MTKLNVSIRNQQLHDSLSRYAQRAIEVLAKRIEEKAVIPTLPETVWTFQGDSHFLVGQAAEKPFWSIFLHQSRQALEQLPDYQLCLTLLREDSVIGTQIDQLVGIAASKMRIDPTWILDRLVISAMPAKATQPVFHQELFEREYSRFEDSFYESTIAIEAVAPLQGFRMDSDSISIEHDLKIARLTMEQIEACIRAGIIQAAPLQYGMIPNPPEFAVELTYQQPKHIGDEQPKPDQLQKTREIEQETHERISRVINALRLWKVGDFWTTGRIEIPISWLLSFTRSSSMGAAVHPWGGNYLLTKEEVWVFQPFWNIFQTAVANRKFLDVAVKRFDYAYERFRPHDKIIDLMVALEALFLSDVTDHEYRGELRFRLALRAAFFLASSPSERRGIYNLFRDAYDIRSAIVHGGEPELPKGFSSLDEFVNRLADSTRHALHRAILMASSSDRHEFLVDWADLVLSGKDSPVETLSKIRERASEDDHVPPRNTKTEKTGVP